MSNKKIITICSSSAFYREVIIISDKLKKLKYKVLIPETAKIMAKNKNFNPLDYKPWTKDKTSYKKKTLLMNSHFKKVLKANSILVVNDEKNGLKGYIGGNVLMEMVLAYHYKKRIYILNDIDDDLSIKEEIYALMPIIIKNDLNIIK